MTDLDTQVRAKQPEHDEMDRLMAEFLADPKNKIQKLARGESAEAGWTAKQRANPQAQTKASIQRQVDEAAERKARRDESMATPAPRSVKEIKPRRVEIRGPRVYGEKITKVLELLKDGPKSVSEISEAMGASKPCTRTRLWFLRDKGFITSKGDRLDMTWELAKP